MIEPQDWTYEEFPGSKAAPEGMKSVRIDPEHIDCKPQYNREYFVRDGYPLHMHLLMPVVHNQPERVWPLVVYVQGSAWEKQILDSHLLSLYTIAKQGCVCAIIEYRPSDVAPFPAQVQDVKTAIRYLRKHAQELHIDPDKVVVWGDSSGGHTALLTGLTSEHPELDTPELPEYPCDVLGIVDYYGPTDVSKMNEEPSTMDHRPADGKEGKMLGGINVLENPDKVAPTVPMNYVDADVDTPPVFIVHGTKDRLVPFDQSVRLYECLRDNGKQVEFYRLEDADHGGPSFWSPPIIDKVWAFIQGCFTR